MNIKHFASLSLIAAITLSTGCVYYEGCGDEDWDESCEVGDEFGDWDTDGEEQEQADPVVLNFAPGHAEQGETFAAVLTLDSGELDLSDAVLSFYGPVEVMASVNEQGQITAIISVPADAPIGPVDLVLEHGDGQAELLPGAFEIFETGSGNSGTDWTDGGADGECE